MPYTPPASQSPASSKPSTPLLNRSYAQFPLPASTPRTSASRPSLPRSTSSTAYLQRHRRSPSWQQPHTSSPLYEDVSRPATADQAQHGNAISSLRQSPPPVTDSIMPAGAIISPPDSSPSSSDDDEESARGRRREQIPQLEELSEAVHRTLSVRREASPTGEVNSTQKFDNLKLSIPSPSTAAHTVQSARPALTESARKISHSRSSTESAIADIRYTQSARTSHNNSDDSDIEDDNAIKPPLLRKKSGELVKPALRASSRRRPSSMPGTPTYSKAVHFNEDIEQVRHFLQVDRPIAVSAGSSPADPYDDESEFPFGFDDNSNNNTPKSQQWEITLTNFPRDSLERQALPVRLERIFLSTDSKTLIGTVAVANLSFHKVVVARFTLDHWKTTSEIVAEFNHDTRQKPRADGYDQFNFNIRLSDQAHIERKTLMLCIRYNVDGREFWDNNGDMNYSVEFARKAQKNPKPEASAQQGLGARPLGAIPRSRHGGSASVGRPRSMPSFEDDFASGFDNEHGPGIRLKNPTGRHFSGASQGNASGGQPFGHRYDFGASLSAALSQAQVALGDRNVRSKQEPQGSPMELPPAPGSTISPRSGPAHTTIAGTDSPRPDALLAGTKSLDSRAYQEFVSKFCFFGAKPASQPAKPTKLASGQVGLDSNQDSIQSESPSAALSGSGSQSPAFEAPHEQTVAEDHSPHASRSNSPSPIAGSLLSEHAQSPAGFGFQFGHGIFTPDSQTPTAIRG